MAQHIKEFEEFDDDINQYHFLYEPKGGRKPIPKHQSIAFFISPKISEYLTSIGKDLSVREYHKLYTIILQELKSELDNPKYTSNESKSTKYFLNEERKQRVDPWNHAEKTVLNMIGRIPADGPYTVTDPRDGTLIAEVNFGDGVLDGDFKFYRGRKWNAKLSVEGQYIKGMKIGTWNLYGLGGNVIQTELF